MMQFKPPTVAAAAPPPEAPKVAVAASANDARLKVDAAMLKQLTEDFGFKAVRAEKALVLTQNKSVEVAMQWLVDHEADMDIDEPLQVVGAAAAGAVAPVPAGPAANPAMLTTLIEMGYGL
jgi:hypothetical protein